MIQYWRIYKANNSWTSSHYEYKIRFISTLTSTVFDYFPQYKNTTDMPSKAAEFTPKKYVDNKLTTYAGYDSTKTQVLKNINGVFTWVDET